jgi:glucan biosynthesis protein C
MMLLGVFLHILLFSKRAIENRSVFEDYLISGVYFTFHTFRLPAFFVLAGYFACLLIEKRGLNGFMRNRGTRLGLVLVFVAPLIVVTTLYASGRTEAITDVEGVIRIGFMHLWFIYYLLIFSALLYLFSLINTLSRPAGFQARAGVWVSDPRVLSVASLLLMVAPHFLDRRAMIRISTNLLPDFPLFGFYALFFICGIFLFRSGKTGLEALTKRAYLLCVVGMVCAQFAFGWGSNLTTGRLRDFLSIIASFYLAVGVIGLFLRLVKASGPILEYLVRTSYWVYIVHVPVAWLSIKFCDSLGIPPLANIVISFFGVTALSFASFELFVRRTRLSKLV